MQAESPGSGDPLLSGMNIMRQRRGVLDHRCHVCGEVIPPGERRLFPVGTGAFLKVKGGSRYVSHLPPTHAECAARAQRLCPHLRSAYATPLAFPREEGVVSSETSLPDNLRHLAASLPPGCAIGFG